MIVPESYEGARLDRFTSQVLNLPHSLVSKLLRKKEITLNGKRAEISTRLNTGDIIEIPEFLKLTAKEVKRGEAFISNEMMESFKNSIIYDCNDFCAINKPSGLATQGGTGIKLSVDDFLFQLNQEYRLVHRLDRETSGILIIAKSRIAANKIAKDFENKAIKKTYIAIVLGKPEQESGVIDAKIKKQTFADSGGISEIKETGKEAKTYYKILKTNAQYTMLEVEIETGRMHQIRLHLAHIGSFIVGDTKYGETASALAKQVAPKMLLHAYKINYNGLELKCDLPEYFNCF